VTRLADLDLPRVNRPVARLLFKYRSFTPIPWLLAAVAFARPLSALSAVGAALVVAGEALRIWAVGYIGPESRVTRDGPGSSRLVTFGPYGWVRNPLYVGNVLIVAGVALWAGALWPWLALAAAAFFLWQYALITRLEEEGLQQQYGWEYRAYKAVVPAWLPRLAPHPMRLGGPGWRFGGAAFRGELRTLNTVVVVGVLTALAPWLRGKMGLGW
jgi:protein-S-isoprenylcysteine O-methyltransferase Ste14